MASSEFRMQNRKNKHKNKMLQEAGAGGTETDKGGNLRCTSFNLHAPKHTS